MVRTQSVSIFVLAFFLAIPNVKAQKYRLKDIPDEANTPEQEEVLSRPDKKALVKEVAEEFYLKGMEAFNKGELEKAEGFFDRVLILQPTHKEAQKAIDAIMLAYEKEEARSQTKAKKGKKNVLVQKLTHEMNAAFEKGHLEEANRAAEQILAIDPANSSIQKKVKIINRKLYRRHSERGKEFEEKKQYQKALNAYQTAHQYRNEAHLKLKMKKMRTKIAQKAKQQSEELYIQALEASQNGNKEKALELCKKALAINPENLQAKRMLLRLSSTP